MRHARKSAGQKTIRPEARHARRPTGQKRGIPKDQKARRSEKASRGQKKRKASRGQKKRTASKGSEEERSPQETGYGQKNPKEVKWTGKSTRKQHAQTENRQALTQMQTEPCTKECHRQKNLTPKKAFSPRREAEWGVDTDVNRKIHQGVS